MSAHDGPEELACLESTDYAFARMLALYKALIARRCDMERQGFTAGVAQIERAESEARDSVIEVFRRAAGLAFRKTCEMCQADLLFSARQRGAGLCGPCGRRVGAQLAILRPGEP